MNAICIFILDIEAEKCIATKSHDTFPPSSPAQIKNALSRPDIEFGKAMTDLTDILHCDGHALQRMLIAFEQTAHYIKNKEYIAIVQSQEYGRVDSVRALFLLLAPHWKPVDCSLLKLLVEVAGVEQAVRRLDDYLHVSNHWLLDNGSNKDTKPQETETLLLINSQPVANSTSVLVTILIKVEEMSVGVFRHIKSFLCGMFRIPSYALQYVRNEPGSVIVTCITSLEMLSQIQCTLLDDGDMLLLLRKKIFSLRIGKDYIITAGNHDYWKVRRAQ